MPCYYHTSCAVGHRKCRPSRHPEITRLKACTSGLLCQKLIGHQLHHVTLSIVLVLLHFVVTELRLLKYVDHSHR